MKNQKLIKSARIIDWFLQMARALILFSVLLYIFEAIATFFLTPIPDGLLTLGNSDLTFLPLLDCVYPDYPSYMHSDSYHFLQLSQVISYLAIGISIVVSWYCIKFLRQIIAPMKEGLPFQPGTSRIIRKFAWITLIGSGLTQVGSFFGQLYQIRAYDLNALINPEFVSSFHATPTINTTFIDISLFFLFLSYIFRYGESLQQLADETL